MATSRRHGVLASLAGGSLGTVLAWGAFAVLADAAPPPSSDDALASVAAWLPLPAALVLLQVAVVSALRFVSGAFDPLRDSEGPVLRVSQRVLANTVEQTAVFVPALIGAAVLSGPGEAPMLIAGCWIFVGARLLFWAGYLVGPLYRAAGMAATLNVNAALLAFALWRLLDAAPVSPG